VKRLCHIVGLIILISFAVYAQQFTVKFATIAPEGSTWMNVMREYDAAIRKESGGRVGFKIYSGGVQGDEKSVLRKIRVGQLHSGGFTGVGMGEIAPKVRVLDSPFLVRNEDEVDMLYKEYGKEFGKSRNVRVYAGNYLVYYAQIVEYNGKQFMRPALNSSKAEIRSILENG